MEEAAENNSRRPDTAEAVTVLLGRDPQAMILAEQDGVLIGSIIAGWDGWRYHLYRLAVRPESVVMHLSRSWAEGQDGHIVQQQVYMSKSAS